MLVNQEEISQIKSGYPVYGHKCKIWNFKYCVSGINFVIFFGKGLKFKPVKVDINTAVMYQPFIA